jgi:hypothetical protein
MEDEMSMDARPGARRRRRGVIFVFAVMALTVLLLLGTLSLQLTTQSMRYAAAQRNLAVALHLAEATADLALATLAALSTPPTSAFACPANGVLTLSTGTSRAVVQPFPDNAGQWLKKYRIIATGHSAIGGAERTVIVQVRQQSFALYAYFTDQERSSVTNSAIWFYARDRIYGPTHSNDLMHIAWDRTATYPIFNDTVSTAQDSIDWSTSGTPRTSSEWHRVLSGGEAALTLGMSRIVLPRTTELQRSAAWGAASGFPASGVHVPNNGIAVTAGIYIAGDSSIVLSDLSPGNAQVVTITQGSTVTTITTNLAANTTTVTVGMGIPRVYSGLPNGVLYSTGTITSLRGTLADNYVSGTTIVRRNGWTIATDSAAGKDIHITNSLAYRTKPDATQPLTHISNLRAAVLGLLAHDIKLTGACPADMAIDGVMMAGSESTPDGSFWYEKYDTVKRNALNLFGGIIQKKRGPVGTFNMTTNTSVTGYSKNYRYDVRMADTPPPYYPTTGQYDTLSWQYR